MRIRLITFGSNWWSTHSRDLADPYCFQTRAAWFNSAGLFYGARLRLCWAFPGQIRFNAKSGFNPDRPGSALGRIFESRGPISMNRKMNLLLHRSKNQIDPPEKFLVTLNSANHGQIASVSGAWRSGGAQPISVSLRQSRYEAMILLTREDWVRTELGVWAISKDGERLELVDRREGVSQ